MWYNSPTAQLKVVPVLNKAPHHEVWGCEGTAPHIPNLVTRWSVVGITLHGQRAPITHRVSGWVDPRGGWQRENAPSCLELNQYIW